jgi:adenine deaminase
VAAHGRVLQKTFEVDAKTRIWLLASVTALATFITGASAQHDERRGNAGQAIALIGGTLIDGTGGQLIRNSVVLIRGERIERLGTIGKLQVPSGCERVSTEGMSFLPGLWDPHVHLIMQAIRIILNG